MVPCTRRRFLSLFKELFDPAASAIRDVICEYAPQPPSQFLGDGTAFDAIVFYETADGAPRFMGIETKYTEPFSATEYDGDRYQEITTTSGWFEDPLAARNALRGSASNQLWRNVMLAAAVEQSTPYGRGSVAVVAIDDDAKAASAIGALRECLTDQSRLVWAPLEAIVAAADAMPGLAAWSSAFRLRYLP